MITLSDYLEEFEFTYRINDNNTISLVDMQGANLGGIEDDEYEINEDLPRLICDRMSTYENDYIFNPIIEELQEYFDYDGEVYPYDECILPELKKHSEHFTEKYISFVEDIINCDVDISELYKKENNNEQV